jgi:putative ubiquitin-RnfH superfamily antitoxin RatB of RatAB toxin-antitoxin module
MSDYVNIEVVYALPDEQRLFVQQLAVGATAEEAIRRCGILEHYPEIDLAENKLGIFGKLAKPDTVLRDRDRVEIYRPLVADPKEVRRRRAAEGKTMKKGGDT